MTNKNILKLFNINNKKTIIIIIGLVLIIGFTLPMLTNEGEFGGIKEGIQPIYGVSQYARPQPISSSYRVISPTVMSQPQNQPIMSQEQRMRLIQQNRENVERSIEEENQRLRNQSERVRQWINQRNEYERQRMYQELEEQRAMPISQLQQNEVDRQRQQDEVDRRRQQDEADRDRQRQQQYEAYRQSQRAFWAN